jgi:hypothetical protein
MKFEADELLNAAIMSKTPFVIVEGVDDIRIYEEIARSAEVACEIYAVASLEGLSGGNDGVIEAIELVESLSLPPGKSVDQFLMGIIDCDARFYRNEMPSSPSIFCLDAYSIESHFVSKFVLKPSIDRLTRTSLRDYVDVDFIYSNIESNVADLYYFSLDALRNAVDPSYRSLVGFSSNAGRRKDGYTKTELLRRASDLDAFAASFNLGSDIASLRKFVKGKWLLTAFSEELFHEIERLTDECKNSRIQKCSVCSVDNSFPCLFRLKEGFTSKSLYSLLTDMIRIPDFDYLRNAFVSLAASAR